MSSEKVYPARAFFFQIVRDKDADVELTVDIERNRDVRGTYVTHDEVGLVLGGQPTRGVSGNAVVFIPWTSVRAVRRAG